MKSDIKNLKKRSNIKLEPQRSIKRKNVIEAAAERKTEAEKQHDVEAAAWLENVKVADEANEASAQKQEMDADAAAAKKKTKEKEGSTANSQERSEEEFTKDNDEIHNKTETATETTRTGQTIRLR